jgi:hypothetical protein
MKLGNVKASSCAYGQGVRVSTEIDMSDMEKFLTPESMLTPGLAGGMTMGITNALAMQFALVAPGPALIALALSFVFGLCVFSSKSAKRAAKLLFWVVNSLVIFTVASGSNSLGAAAATAQAQAAPRSAARALIEGLVPSAQAQTQFKWCCLDGNVLLLTAAVCGQKNGKTTDTKPQAQQVCKKAATEAQTPPPPQSQSQQPFFRPWIKPA